MLSSLVNNRMALKDFDQGDDKIRGYFGKMNPVGRGRTAGRSETVRQGDA